MKEAIIVFLFALVVGAFINGFSNVGAPATPEPQPGIEQPSSSGASVSDTSDTGFDNDVLTSTSPVLVDFYSNTCAPCRQMAPVVDKLATEYGDKVKVVRLDVDTNPSVTARFNVATIPTFIVFKNGERGESFTGLVPKEILSSAINKSLQ